MARIDAGLSSAPPVDAPPEIVSAARAQFEHALADHHLVARLAPDDRCASTRA